MSCYPKYFPPPTIVNVREDGSFSLEWCEKNRRCSINYESKHAVGNEPGELYGIYCAKTETELIVSEVIPLATQADVVKLLSETMGLVPEE